MTGKNAFGLRGFPTPNDISPDGGYVVFRVPKDNQWAGLILGAAQLLSYSYNFYEWGDMTPDEAAEAFRQIVDQAPYETCGCVYPNGKRILRLNSSGHVEQLTDGEWTEPTDDYAIPPVPPRTELTCDERRCLAAANAAHVLEVLYETVADAIAEGADEAEALAVLIGAAIIIIGGWLGLVLAALVTAIVGAFVGFVELATELTADLWTADFTQALFCMLYRCSSCDGDVVHFDFQCVREEMAAYVDLLDPNFITNLRLFGQVDFILNVIGADGLDAAGATTAVETADCADCGGPWCRLYDFTVDPWQFEPQAFGATPLASWVDGVGWQSIFINTGGGDPNGYTISAISAPFSATIQYIEIGFTYSAGSLDATGESNSLVGDSGAYVFWSEPLNPVLISPQSFCYKVLDPADPVNVAFNLQAALFPGTSADGSDPGGSAVITYIKVMGIGEPPPGGETCEWVDCEP